MTTHPPRTALTLAVLTALTLGLVPACSGGQATPAASGGGAATSGASGDAAAPAVDLPPAEGKTTYPLTLTSPFGTTVLPQRPKRIAAITPTAIDSELLLALGVRPVLNSSLVDEGGYLADHGAKGLATYPFQMGQELPIEKIAASEPDLIVAVGWTDGLGGADLGDYYERLSKIAPVVTSADTKSRLLVPWEESIRTLGDALDLRADADRVVDRYQKDLAALRAAHPETKGRTATWAISYAQPNGLTYFSQPGSAAEDFLVDLGFTKNPKAKAFATSPKVSNELLPSLDADLLLLGRSASQSEADFAKLTNGPLFRKLGAVSSGHWVAIPPKTEDGKDLLWAVTSGGPIGKQWAAGRLAPLISTALTSGASATPTPTS